MKKALMLFTLGLLTLVACEKKFVLEAPTKDASLKGEEVSVKEFPADVKKIFVLNEGQMGANNATLDFLRRSDGQYITGAFKKMNPSAAAGLGDVGNDIALHNNEVWMVINNSGLVEVVSAADETEIAVIEIPTPRNVAFDDKYAYVTSWAGAFATYEGYEVVDSSNPKGCVYRINLSTYKVEGSVEVGYQPEGIAYYDGKLYVANSGGISSQLPPLYAYDNTVSVIDTKSFAVTRTVEVQVNLKNVYADGKGHIFVTSQGNYDDVHSGLYMFPASNPDQVTRVERDFLKHTHVSCSFALGEEIFCIGTENEFAFNEEHVYVLWSYNGVKDKVTLYPVILDNVPYSMGVVEDDMGLRTLLVGNVLLVNGKADYINPGKVTCYRLYDAHDKVWSVTAGVCPGHFAVWK